jgi:hypothetical protein
MMPTETGPLGKFGCFSLSVSWSVKEFSFSLVMWISSMSNAIFIFSLVFES